MKSSSQSGFALPTVLIAGIVMMIVLMTALVAASGGRANFDSQYYTRIAREAAESGALYAQECMVSHDYAVPWSGDDLHTGQDCDASGAESYMIESDDYRVKYVVADMPDEPDQNVISVTGYVERTRRSSGAVWRTYEYRLNIRASSETSAQRIAFGYSWGGHDTSSAYGAHFGVLTAAGDIMGVGNNSRGQLGNGTTTNILTPERYQLPIGVRASKVNTNFLSLGISMYAITTEGELYASGRNTDGMLTGITNPITTPQLISFTGEDVGVTSQVVEVSNMENSTYVTLSNGKIYASGNCSNGKLGTGTGCSNTDVMSQVDLPSGVSATGAVVADGTTAYALTTTGRVYGWGRNADGMLGMPMSTTSTPTPTRIGTFGDGGGAAANSPAVSVSTDGRSVYIVTAAGHLWALGVNDRRQIANNSTQRYTSPHQVAVSGCTGNVIDAKTDHSHVAVLTSTGQVCTAGYNASGQLGRGSNATDAPFGRVTLPSGVLATSIWVNSVYSGDNGRSNNTFIVGDNGSVYGAGANYYGQLGDGTTTNRSSPRRMNVFGSESGRTPAMSVRSGYGTTIIFAQNGRIYAVGDNRSGQLGDGTTTNSPTPRATRFLNIGSPSYF